MTRRLLLVGEIADLLGVNRQRIYQFIRDEDFPEPVGETARGRVWDGAEVEAWATARPDRPHGPPSRIRRFG